MKVKLYFNKNGYCTGMQKFQGTLCYIVCEIKEDFTPEGVPIEEFFCDPSFKIEEARHL